MVEPVNERKPPGQLVDLGLRRAREREPDVRLVLELWRLEDGRVAYDAHVEEYVVEGRERLTSGWLREQLRWALLCYAKLWRLGIRQVRRGKVLR